MYPPLGHINFNYGAPVYPLLSGGIETVTRIGHGTAFPSSAALGHSCNQGLSTMAGWALKSDAIIPTLRIAYLGWIFLLAGVVAVLRVSGRGLSGWELIDRDRRGVPPASLDERPGVLSSAGPRSHGICSRSRGARVQGNGF